MAGRIDSIRKQLRAALEKRQANKDWSFVTSQIGMFSFTGLSPAQVLGGLRGCCCCCCCCCCWSLRAMAALWQPWPAATGSSAPFRPLTRPPPTHRLHTPPSQVANMTNKWEIYMTADGRISLAGLNKASVDRLADAVVDSFKSA
jgi:hypothetical protein